MQAPAAAVQCHARAQPARWAWLQPSVRQARQLRRHNLVALAEGTSGVTEAAAPEVAATTTTTTSEPAPAAAPAGPEATDTTAQAAAAPATDTAKSGNGAAAAAAPPQPQAETPSKVKEKEFKTQLDELKERATASHREAIQHAQQVAFGSIRTGAGGEDAAALRGRLEAAIVAMQEGLVERDVEVRLLLLAALAGEHILYIGPPGTAKSELGRRLSRLCHGSYFERLLTRFSVPEELFGPLSMRALEEDKYIRQTDGYLPEATVAFVDEIFKANSAILNTLLTILNERLFDNGNKRIHVPLLCLVGASNELPESEELDALYDRFLIRRQVSQVSKSGLIGMLAAGGAGAKQAKALRSPGEETDSEASAAADAPQGALLTEDDFANTRRRAVAAVETPPAVLEIISDLRSFLQEKCEPPVYVSDRRLVKAVTLLQVAAYTNGRTRLSEHDCLLLQHVLWARPEEGERIYEWLISRLAEEDSTKQPDFIFAGIFANSCKLLGSGQPVADEVAELLQDVVHLREALKDQLANIFSAMEGGFPALAGSLWFGEEEGQAVASALLPKLERGRGEIERLLFEVVTLEAVLHAGDVPMVDIATLLPDRWAAFLRAPRR